jgi:hypothetical protein
MLLRAAFSGAAIRSEKNAERMTTQDYEKWDSRSFEEFDKVPLKDAKKKAAQ